MTIGVYRRGAAADELTMYLRATDVANFTTHRGCVAMAFRTGGGVRATDWSVQIGSDSYDELTSLMMSLAPDRAIKAFKKQLAKAKRSKSKR